jgi:predicted phage tail protein
MRVILHGQLREMYGESVTINASSIADAIEGASRQLADWPRTLALNVAGYNTKEELYSSRPDEVHLMPAMQGGSSKVFNFVLGAALIVVGVLLGGTVGISLIVSGALMIMQGVIQLFMKAPKIDAEDNPEESKYLGLNQNTTANRTPITNAWGLVKLHPHWLSLQSDSSLMAHGSYPVSPT